MWLYTSYRQSVKCQFPMFDATSTLFKNSYLLFMKKPISLKVKMFCVEMKLKMLQTRHFEDLSISEILLLWQSMSCCLAQGYHIVMLAFETIPIFQIHFHFNIIILSIFLTLPEKIFLILPCACMFICVFTLCLPNF